MKSHLTNNMKPFEKVGECEIRGFWNEDNSGYSITVPAQLCDELLHVLNKADDLYDSRLETLKHKDFVRWLLGRVASKIKERGLCHDDSKLGDIERRLFDEFTPKLHGLTYGGVEYKKCLDKMKPALDNHYKQNRHHPEHFREGIKGMNLIDLIEMICDWSASSKRHADGNIFDSITINQKRFGYSDELKQILFNTVYEVLDYKSTEGFQG